MARSLWRSVLTVSSGTMSSRVLGLIRDMVLLKVFGASGLMDAFLVAFKIPNFFRRLFAEGAFSQAFVPILTEYKTQRLHGDVQLLVAKVSGSLSLIILILTALVTVFAPVVIYAFAPGFHGNGLKFDTAVTLLQVMFPYLLFMSLTAFSSSVLNSYGSFFSASFSPVLLNVCMIAAALLAPHMAVPIMTLGWGVLLAGILQLAIQLPELAKKRLLVWPRLDFKDEGVVRVFKLMLPALFGVSVVQINLLLNTVWASFMTEGSVSWMYTAERLTELPLGLIGVAIGTVILPSLSSVHTKQDHGQFRQLLDWATKIIMLVGIPASLAMWMLAEPMIQALFERGQFGYHDAHMSALALEAMSVSILAFMLIKVFAPGFYAQQDSKTPVRIGLIAVGVNIAMSAGLVALFRWMQWPAQHLALAAASTVAALVNASLLYRNLSKRNIFSFGPHWKRLALIYAAANALMIGILWAGLQFYPVHGEPWLRILALVGLCVAGAAAYGGGLLALGFRPRELKHG